MNTIECRGCGKELDKANIEKGAIGGVTFSSMGIEKCPFCEILKAHRAAYPHLAAAAFLPLIEKVVKVVDEWNNDPGCPVKHPFTEDVEKIRGVLKEYKVVWWANNIAESGRRCCGNCKHGEYRCAGNSDGVTWCKDWEGA